MEGIELFPEDVKRIDSYRTSRKVSILAITFSDIVGYTALCERLPEHAMAVMREEFERLSAENIEERRAGLIVKRIGDAVLSVFAEPTSAVLAMLSLHNAVKSRSIAGQTLQLRSGVHLGQVAVTRVGMTTDVFGRHVNRAARVQAAADPGQVLVTEPVADNVHGWVAPNEPSLRFFGRTTRVLKGIDDAVTIFRVEFGDGREDSLPGLVRPRIHLCLTVGPAGAPDGERQKLVFDAERDRRVIVGRAESCDVCIASTSVSRKHAMISYEEQGVWMVADLGTVNGTLIGGEKIRARVLLVGDEIQLGDWTVRVEGQTTDPQVRVTGTRSITTK